MARRKKPKITGEDPKYAHTFERLRPVDSDMPPDVKIPGLEEQTAPASKPADPSAKTAPTQKPKAKAPKANNPRPTKIAPKPQVAPQTSQKPRGDRQTTLDAAVKVEQAAAMEPLLAKGLLQKDIVTLAGRRATEQFILSPTYVPKPEGERLPMQDGYHTSKRLNGEILDAMRAEHDPLGVRSDPAMVRGQFETLFWSVLDDVIRELREKYA